MIIGLKVGGRGLLGFVWGFRFLGAHFLGYPRIPHGVKRGLMPGLYPHGRSVHQALHGVHGLGVPGLYRLCTNPLLMALRTPQRYMRSVR